MLATACDSIFGSSKSAFADEARVIVDGTSPEPLLLITSTEFLTTRDPVSDEVVTTLIVSDTVTLATLPGEAFRRIRGADRFLARIANSDSASTADIHMRVMLDDKLVFDQRALMRNSSLEFTAFYQR